MVKLKSWSTQLCGLLALLVWLSHPADTWASNGEIDWVQARTDFSNARKYLYNGHLQKHEILTEKLKRYPLYPYLLYYRYLRYISSTPAEDIEAFLSQYSELPIAYRLRRQWLKKLAARKDWQQYIEFFEPTRSAELNCYYRWAQYQTGAQQEALDHAKELWLVGHSQDAACDPLFKIWMQSDHFTKEVVWQRIELAFDHGRSSLANYLKQFLPEDEQGYVDEWRRIRSYPTRVKKISRYKGDSEYEQAAILYGLKRILWDDQDQAIQLWSQYREQIDFQPQRADAFTHYMARYLGAKYHPAASLWLTKANPQWQQEDWLERHIRVALREQNWPTVLHWIELLPAAQQTESQWLYWRARAYEALAQQQEIAGIISPQPAREVAPEPVLGFQLEQPFNVMNVHDTFVRNAYETPDPNQLVPQLIWQADAREWNQQAQSIYQELTTRRNFYAFLASQRLGQPISLHADLSAITDLELLKIESYPGVQRARELYLLGRPGDARSEWYYATRQLTAREKSAAAKLAEIWGWHNRAIITAASSDQRDNLELRFPTAYQNAVSYYSTKHGVNSDLVFSVIRQESAFTPDARSSAGALGMMQIMPATAKQLSRQVGVGYRSRRQLLDPDHNIRLGTYYLSQLMNRFDNNIILATAAYNAGPYRVKRWLPENQPLPGDIWVETIPIHETRNYVKNILTYQPIYRHHLGKDVQLTESLARINPRNPVIVIPTALAQSEPQEKTSKN